jgi:hypothetical protein
LQFELYERSDGTHYIQVGGGAGYVHGCVLYLLLDAVMTLVFVSMSDGVAGSARLDGSLLTLLPLQLYYKNESALTHWQNNGTLLTLRGCSSAQCSPEVCPAI